MTSSTNRTAFPIPIPRVPARARHARGVQRAHDAHGTRRRRRESSRRRGTVLASAVLVCAGAMCCVPALARETRTAHAAHPASAPRTTADALGPPPAPGQYAPAPPTDGAVYRCGNSYSAQPCGTQSPLDVDDARTASQRRQAEDVAARDKRLATWLEAQRHERDAAASAPKKSRAADPGCAPTAAVVVACPRRVKWRRAVSKPSTPATSAGPTPAPAR